MALIQLTWDSSEIDVWRTGKVDAALARAVRKAGSDALRFMKAGSSRLIRGRKRMRVSRVNKSLPLAFPKGGGLAELEWRMDVSGAPIPAIDFPNRQTARGVSLAVNAAKRTLVKGAFIATMRSGHRGIFLRAKSGMHGPLTKKRARSGDVFRVGRLPIEELFSTRVSDVFNDSGFVDFIQKGTQVKFGASVSRLLPMELGRVK